MKKMKQPFTILSVYLPCAVFAFIGSLVTQAIFNGFSSVDVDRAMLVSVFVIVMLIITEVVRVLLKRVSALANRQRF